MLDNDVEQIVGTHLADVELGGERPQIGFDGAGGRSGGAGRAIEAGADPALDAQRRLVDADRRRLEHELVAGTHDGDPKIDPRPEGDRVDRPGEALVGPAAEREIEDCAGAKLVERQLAGDHRGDARSLAGLDARALQHPFEAVALAQGRGDLDRRPLRRLRQCLDRFGRDHVLAGVCAQSERRDRKRLRFHAVRFGNGRRGGGHRPCLGRQRPGADAQSRAGREAAKPFLGADADAEIDDEIEVRRKAAAHVGLATEVARDSRALEGAVPHDDRRAARLLDVLELVQGLESPPFRSTPRLGRCADF